MRCEAIDLDENILLAREDRNSRQPILFFDRAAGARPIFRREYPCRGGEIRAGDFASDGARCDSHFRIISDALVFPGIAARHYIKFIVLLSKPNRRGNSGTTFTKGRKADVFLALNFPRDGHRDIVRERKR